MLMSTHISTIHTKEIRNNLRPLYANWEPAQPISQPCPSNEYQMLRSNLTPISNAISNELIGDMT